MPYSMSNLPEAMKGKSKKPQGAMPWHLKAALQLPVEIEQNPVGVVKSVNTEKRLATFVVLEPQDDDGMTTGLNSGTGNTDGSGGNSSDLNLDNAP